MAPKKNNILLILIFLAFITLPLIFSDKIGGKISLTENRTLAPFPSLSSQDAGQQTGIRKGLENWIADNAGFRTTAKKMQAAIDFRLFRISPSPMVHIGKNGWYFYTGDDDLKIGMRTYAISPELLENIRKNQVKIQKALKKKGIEYVIVFTPSKSSVYPEYIRGGNFSVGPTLIDIVSDYLRKNTTIPIINTKPDLLQDKETETVYLKTDTHWNPSGAFVGYRSIINTLNGLGMIHTSPINVSLNPSTIKGEFSAMMGDPDLLPAEPVKSTVIVAPKAHGIEDSDYVKSLQALMNVDKVNFWVISFENPNVEKKRLLIYGDSFFAVGKMTELLAENFSSLDFIRSDSIRENVIEQAKPDILIMERTERYIFSLAFPPDQQLIASPLQNPEANIVSDSTPSQVNRQAKLKIEIAVKNTGTETWNEDNQIRLAIFQDGVDKYRVALPDGLDVNPGESYIFTFEDFQAPYENSTYLEYQMVNEGVQYFGEKKRVDITIDP